jgi:hypothetical protein
MNTLIEQNNEIMHSLIHLMNNRRQNNSTNNINNSESNSNTNQRNYRNNRIRNDNTNNNNSLNNRRVLIDNIPYYIIDEIEFYTVPNNINGGSNSNGNGNENRRAHQNRFRRQNNNYNQLEDPILDDRNLNNQFSRLLNSFLQPINIVPTQSQIENATRNITYSDILDPINTSCPISLETFADTSRVTMIRQCRHIFNTQYLMSWFNSSCRCPVCRCDIREYVQENHENQDNQEEESDESINNNSSTSTNNSTTNSTTNNTTNSTTNSRSNITSNSSQHITNHAVNLLENLFHDTITDISNNNIRYSFDNIFYTYPNTRHSSRQSDRK